VLTISASPATDMASAASKRPLSELSHEELVARVQSTLSLAKAKSAKDGNAGAPLYVVVLVFGFAFSCCCRESAFSW
jgi:hypothetical protein